MAQARAHLESISFLTATWGACPILLGPQVPPLRLYGATVLGGVSLSYIVCKQTYPSHLLLPPRNNAYPIACHVFRRIACFRSAFPVLAQNPIGIRDGVRLRHLADFSLLTVVPSLPDLRLVAMVTSPLAVLYFILVSRVVVKQW